MESTTFDQLGGGALRSRSENLIIFTPQQLMESQSNRDTRAVPKTIRALNNIERFHLPLEWFLGLTSVTFPLQYHSLSPKCITVWKFHQKRPAVLSRIRL